VSDSEITSAPALASGAAPSLVSLDHEREKRGGPYQMPCPKCGRRLRVDSEHCPSCGAWFDGPAFVFSGRRTLFGAKRPSRMQKRSLVLGLTFAGLMLLALLLVFAR
jgi:hypothetical protein